MPEWVELISKTLGAVEVVVIFLFVSISRFYRQSLKDRQTQAGA